MNARQRKGNMDFSVLSFLCRGDMPVYELDNRRIYGTPELMEGTFVPKRRRIKDGDVYQAVKYLF